jgi:hypothetical protein
MDEARRVARELNLQVVRNVVTPDMFLLREIATMKRLDRKLVVRELERIRGVKFAEEVKMVPKPESLSRRKRNVMLNDPLYPAQWHLPFSNFPQAWAVSRGENTIVQIVDDGCDITHPDLAPNYRPDFSKNFNSGSSVEGDKTQNFHGTACAGIAIGANNTVCGVGGAYRASWGCIRLIAEAFTTIEEAEAVTYKFENTRLQICFVGFRSF